MRKFGVTSFFIILLLVACQPTPTESSIPNITDLETAYSNQPTEENLAVLIAAYKADTTGQYLLSAAHLELEHDQFEEGINTLKMLLKKQLTPEHVLDLATAYEDQQKLTIASIIHKAYLTAFSQDVQNQTVKQRLLGDAVSLESQMKSLFKGTYIDSLSRMDTRVAKQYIASSEAYALILPNSDSAVIHLRQAAETANSLGDFETALRLQDWIMESYPNTTDAQMALFMSAFLYENQLGNIEEARIRYEKFLQLYPKSDFADDAKISLKYLGEDPSSVLDKIQNNSSQ